MNDHRMWIRHKDNPHMTEAEVIAYNKELNATVNAEAQREYNEAYYKAQGPDSQRGRR